jgi:hypothetical protein
MLVSLKWIELIGKLASSGISSSRIGKFPRIGATAKQGKTKQKDKVSLLFFRFQKIMILKEFFFKKS